MCLNVHYTDPFPPVCRPRRFLPTLNAHFSRDTFPHQFVDFGTGQTVVKQVTVT